MRTTLQAKHAVVCAVGTGGDVFPFIEIARALAARGLGTTLLAPGRYASHAQKAGVDCHSIGADDVFDDVFNRPAVWQATTGLKEAWRYYGAAMRSGLPLLRAGWNPADTILVSSSFALAARLAEDADGFRNLTVHLSPSIIWSAQRPPRWPLASIPPHWPLPLRRLGMRLSEAAFVDPVARRAVNPLRRELGLPAVRRVFSHYLHARSIAYAFPEWFAPGAADWPPQGHFAGFVMQPSGTTLPQQVAAFIEGHKVAVITAGTGVATSPPWLAHACDAALAQGYRVLLVSHAKTPRDHPHVLAVPFVAFDALLPRAGLLVHHGGIGTMAEAMRAGVPQLLVPSAHDQHDNAARLESLGCGMQVSAGAGLEAFGQAMAHLASPLPRKALQNVRALMQSRQDGAARIASLALD